MSPQRRQWRTGSHPRGSGARGSQRYGVWLVALAALALLAVPVTLILLAGAPPWAGRAAAPAANAPADPAQPGAQALLGRLTDQVDGLARGIGTLEERIEGNRKLIAVQAEGLTAERARLDPVGPRLDALARQIEQLETRIEARADPVGPRLDTLAGRLNQVQALIDAHETRIEDNSVRLYETLMGVDANERTLARLDARVLGAEGVLWGLPWLPPVSASGPGGAGAGLNVARPLAAALGLLLSVGILLYAYARRGGAAARAGAGTDAAAALLAIAGAALGFLLLGVGLRAGTSLGGLLGTPFEPLAALLSWERSDARLPLILDSLLWQMPVLTAMTLLGVVTAGSRLSAGGALLVGLALGGVLLPLFGHWSGVPAADTQAAGWLAGLGFSDAAGVAGTALVGGGAALALARGLGAGVAAPPEPGGTAGAAGLEPTLLAIAALLIWVGWLGPLPATVGAGSAAILVVTAWVAAAGAVLGAALPDTLRAGGPAVLHGWAPALVAAVVAVPALGASATPLLALPFGAGVGLLHALLAPVLTRDAGRDAGAVELAAAFVIAGMAAALAPVLAGSDITPPLPTVVGLPVQLLGAGLALGLGVGGGLLLARAARSLPGFAHRPPASAGQPSPAEAAAKT